MEAEDISIAVELAATADAGVELLDGVDNVGPMLHVSDDMFAARVAGADISDIHSHWRDCLTTSMEVLLEVSEALRTDHIMSNRG